MVCVRLADQVVVNMDETAQSFLGIEGLHVFITGARGGIGSAAVKEFLGKSTKEN